MGLQRTGGGLARAHPVQQLGESGVSVASAGGSEGAPRLSPVRAEARLEGSFVVKRSNFGIAKMKGAVGEKLHMIVAVEGIKKK